MPARRTISAALASIFLSTSHRETTSTGATWRSRSTSILPYQPEPISPTRFAPGAVNAAAGAGSPIPERTNPLEAAPTWRNSRRFMSLLPVSAVGGNAGETSTQDRAMIRACQPARRFAEHVPDEYPSPGGLNPKIPGVHAEDPPLRGERQRYRYSCYSLRKNRCRKGGKETGRSVSILPPYEGGYRGFLGRGPRAYATQPSSDLIFATTSALFLILREITTIDEGSGLCDSTIQGRRECERCSGPPPSWDYRRSPGATTWREMTPRSRPRTAPTGPSRPSGGPDVPPASRTPPGAATPSIASSSRRSKRRAGTRAPPFPPLALLRRIHLDLTGLTAGRPGTGRVPPRPLARGARPRRQRPAGPPRLRRAMGTALARLGAPSPSRMASSATQTKPQRLAISGLGDPLAQRRQAL